MNVSEIQINILNYLKDRCYLYWQSGLIIGTSSWIDMGSSSLFINGNTYKSLLKNGLIQFISSDIKSFNRRKYTISKKSIDLLKEINNDK